ncbi:MAG TPA: SGNH/GDSL hydrolase family protein [Solirubrobacterales bacterium]|jgi:lysophospholipase L1-like esterase|nr:SGNH/GDSL hydrolase family protein [Solirubrobacterales bacterium]
MSVSDPPAGPPMMSDAPERGRIVSTYVALGDSFTAGQGSADGERWPDRLAASLRAVNPELTYRNLAVDGASSAAVLEQIPVALELKPDLVTVICGANDVLLTSRPDIEGYERRFSEILARLRDAAPEAAILTTTAPESWHFMELRPRTKARLVKALSELNAVTRTVAARHRVPCLNVAGHPGLTDRANFSLDGLHPSAQGHERATQEIALSLRAHFGIQGEFQDDFQGGT